MNEKSCNELSLSVNAEGDAYLQFQLSEPGHEGKIVDLSKISREGKFEPKSKYVSFVQVEKCPEISFDDTNRSESEDALADFFLADFETPIGDSREKLGTEQKGPSIPRIPVDFISPTNITQFCQAEMSVKSTDDPLHLTERTTKEPQRIIHRSNSWSETTKDGDDDMEKKPKSMYCLSLSERYTAGQPREATATTTVKKRGSKYRRKIKDALSLSDHITKTEFWSRMKKPLMCIKKNHSPMEVLASPCSSMNTLDQQKLSTINHPALEDASPEERQLHKKSMSYMFPPSPVTKEDDLEVMKTMLAAAVQSMPTSEQVFSQDEVDQMKAKLDEANRTIEALRRQMKRENSPRRQRRCRSQETSLSPTKMPRSSSLDEQYPRKGDENDRAKIRQRRLRPVRSASCRNVSSNFTRTEMPAPRFSEAGRKSRRRRSSDGIDLTEADETKSPISPRTPRPIRRASVRRARRARSSDGIDLRGKDKSSMLSGTPKPTERHLVGGSKSPPVPSRGLQRSSGKRSILKEDDLSSQLPPRNGGDNMGEKSFDRRRSLDYLSSPLPPRNDNTGEELLDRRRSLIQRRSSDRYFMSSQEGKDGGNLSPENMRGRRSDPEAVRRREDLLARQDRKTNVASPSAAEKRLASLKW